MTQARGLALAASFALIFTLFVNAGTVTALFEGRPMLPLTGIRPGSIDEAHTFALMREVSEGHLRLGSASLKEPRDDGVGLTYGPLLQGALLRFTGWDITTIVFLGDFLLPFFIALLFLRIASLLITEKIGSVLTAIISLNVIGPRWLRSINPQVSFLVFAAYLVLFLDRKRGRRNSVLRCFLLLLLLPVHIHFALYALTLEWCDAFRLILLRRKEWKTVLMEVLFVTIPLGIAFTLRTQLPKTLDLLDAERRMGLIPSHLPASPRLQIIVLIMMLVVVVVLFRNQRRGKPTETLSLLLPMLFAGLVVLNQSVLHGKDAIFGVYYEPILMVIAAFALCAGLAHVIRKKTLLVSLLGAIALWSTVQVARNLRELSFDQRAQAFPTKSTMEMIRRVATEPGEQVILAPLDSADLIPVFTPHYVLFNRYSRFGNGSDRELAERFALLRAVLPETAADVDSTYGLLFGQYAGNIAARKRTLCEIRAFLLGTGEMCQANVRNEIFHQDVLRFLEEGTIRPDALLEKYRVNWMIAHDPLPPELRSFCTSEEELRGYTLFRCSGVTHQGEG